MGMSGQLDTGTQIDGGTDNTAIGNTGDRLRVEATISGNAQEAEFATFIATAQSVAIGNNKSMISVVNTTGSTIKIKLRSLKIITAQTVAVTGVIADFRLLRCVTHSAGTSITPDAYETTDSLSASVTVRTGATIGTEATGILRRIQYSTDEWGPGATDVESLDHIMQLGLNLLDVPLKSKPITLLANQGITLKQITNSAVGTFDIELMFTQES